MKKIKILIPIYNDWQSAFKLLKNINSEIVDLEDEVAIGGKVFAVGRFLNKDLQ